MSKLYKHSENEIRLLVVVHFGLIMIYRTYGRKNSSSYNNVILIPMYNIKRTYPIWIL